MGIHFVDCWKLSRFRLSMSHHLAKDSVIDFSENLAYVLVNNHLSQDTNRRTVTPRRLVLAKRVLADIGNIETQDHHHRGQYPRLCVGNHMKTKHRHCKTCHAKKRESYTLCFCRDFGVPPCVASNRHDRDCWAQHFDSSLDELHRHSSTEQL
jgi:hypothetical protein